MLSPARTGKSFWVPERVSSTARESVSPGARRVELGDHRAAGRLVAEPGVDADGARPRSRRRSRRRRRSGAGTDCRRGRATARPTARTWPTRAAMRVARTGRDAASSAARSTRPPSIGKAGRRLKSASIRLATRSVASSPPLASSARSAPGRPATSMTRKSTAGDHQVHRRAGQGDDDLLARVPRNRFEQRQPADRQQGDAARPDAVPPRGQRMAVLVQQHAEEEQDDQLEAGDDRGDVPLSIQDE